MPTKRCRKNGVEAQAVKAIDAAHSPTVSSLVGVVPERLIDEGEQIILAIKPSLWFIMFYSLRWVVPIVLVMLLAWYFRVAIGGFRIVLQSGVAACVAVFLIGFLQWMSRLYVLTNKRVMRIRGVLTVSVFEAPLVKIQNTFISLLLYERIFGLGSIHFTTAGTYGIEASWRSINSPLEVHEIIRQALHKAQNSSNRFEP